MRYVGSAGDETMGDNRSRPDANAKPDKPLPRQPAQRQGGSGVSGVEADEITPYRDRPSHDGKYGDGADEPASGYPNRAPRADREGD